MTPALDRVTVSIAAHYVPARIPFLARSLEVMIDWPVADAAITVVTNDAGLQDEPDFKRVSNALRTKGHSIAIDIVNDLAHPWHLTWWHKRHLRSWIKTARDGELFVYIEDDIAIPAEALAYFRKHVESAKSKGLIPGFLRIENAPDGRSIAADYLGPQTVTENEIVTLGGTRFVAPKFPYWAGFVMDSDLAGEYLASPWSDRKLADTMPQSNGHSCRVQSAWGLTYHKLPEGLFSRMIIPVDDDLQPLDNCMVWHTANNYSVSKKHGFGTVPAKAVFQRPGVNALLRSGRWQTSNFIRRLSARLRRSRL